MSKSVFYYKHLYIRLLCLGVIAPGQILWVPEGVQERMLASVQTGVLLHVQQEAGNLSIPLLPVLQIPIHIQCHRTTLCTQWVPRTQVNNNTHYSFTTILIEFAFFILSLPRLRCHPEVTSDQTKSNAHGVFPDQNYRVWDLVPPHNSMIRGHFGLGMVWSEVTSVWGWYDQRSLRSGDGMIRGHFGLGMVWSEVTSGWEWSDQRRIQAHISLIRDHFERNFFFLIFLFFFFYREMSALSRGNKKQHSNHRHI